MKHISHRNQSGAALVVGLLLLMVLTLLAVSGMNSASVELLMAGNEQYHQNAFQLAESGVEQAWQFGKFNMMATTESETIAGTSYNAVITAPLGKTIQGAIGNNSEGKFKTVHFQIESSAKTTRNATADNVIGVAQIIPPDSTFVANGGDGLGGSGGTTPDLSLH